jgi:surface protein
MEGMFNHAKKFNGDISTWNTSKVEDMSGMFLDSNFNGDISKWDVSHVYNFWRMFYGDAYFN